LIASRIIGSRVITEFNAQTSTSARDVIRQLHCPNATSLFI
jgi:hypothetical protein